MIFMCNICILTFMYIFVYILYLCIYIILTLSAFVLNVKYFQTFLQTVIFQILRIFSGLSNIFIETFQAHFRNEGKKSPLWYPNSAHKSVGKIGFAILLLKYETNNGKTCHYLTLILWQECHPVDQLFSVTFFQVLSL